MEQFFLAGIRNTAAACLNVHWPLAAQTPNERGPLEHIKAEFPRGEGGRDKEKKS